MAGADTELDCIADARVVAEGADSGDCSENDDFVLCGPLAGIVDAASAEKFVSGALDGCSEDQFLSVARAFMGDSFAEWKRCRDAGCKTQWDRDRESAAGRVVNRPIERTAGGLAHVTGTAPPEEDPRRAAADAALARAAP